MAKILDPVRGEGKGDVIVEGTFFPAGTGTPTVTAATGGTVGSSPPGGPGWSVTRTGVGAFLLTFAEKYPSINAKNATIQMAAVTDVVPQFGVFTAGTATTAATLVLTALAAATPTEIAANANNSISFTCIFSTHASPR